VLSAGICGFVQRRDSGPAGCWRSQGVPSPRVAFQYRDAHSHDVNESSSNQHQRLLVVCTVLLIAVLVGACSGAEAKRNETTGASASKRGSRTTTPSTAARLSVTEDDAQVVAAVRTYWATYLELAGRSGPFDANSTRAAIARVATGPAADRLLEVLRTNAAAGYVVRGSIESSPRLVSRVGTDATVRDCYDDRSGLFQVAGGARVDQDDPLRHLAMIGLELQTDGWRVSSVDQPEESCANS
jgi:hypothetical protein